MATKKEVQSVDTASTAVVDSTVSTNENDGTANKVDGTANENDGTVKSKSAFVYAGPSLLAPSGVRLVNNSVLRGSWDEVTSYYKDVLQVYPQARHLIVAIGAFADARKKILTSGNILNKYYNDLISLSKGKVV